MQKRFELFVLALALVISSSGEVSAQASSQGATIDHVAVVSNSARPLLRVDSVDTDAAPQTAGHTEITPGGGLAAGARMGGRAFDPLASTERLSAFGFAQQTAQKPTPPARTGFKALLFETGRDFVTFPRRPSTWVILAIGGGAAALAHPADDEVNAKLVGSDAVSNFFAPGNYIGAVYTQAGAAVGLYFAGRYWLPHKEGEPKTNKVSHLGFDMLRAIIVSQALTQGIKYGVARDRPTGECCAFPSGHASATFATASVLERHLGYRGSWPMLLVATYVSTSRLHDNRHFLSDVVFGSALGMASGWTVVGRHRRDVFALTPVPTRGGITLAVSWRPRDQRSAASRH
jgi:membrane-associated phospholipid phosphatase